MPRSLPISLVFVLACSAGGCGGDGVGASSPERLIEKLATALDELDAAGVDACFDPTTPQGARVGQLCNKAVTVLARGRDLEARIREKYGEEYVTDHVSLPGPALFLREFRERLARASFERGRGNEVRLVVDGEAIGKMYSRGRLWFIQPVGMPFEAYEQMREQANRILDRLIDHVDEALTLVDSSGPETEFRARMAQLGRKTHDACAPVLATLINTMRDRGQLPR